jgi:hypothetical protein
MISEKGRWIDNWLCPADEYVSGIEKTRRLIRELYELCVAMVVEKPANLPRCNEEIEMKDSGLLGDGHSHDLVGE